MRHCFAAILTASLATSAIAQDQPNTILVMDGSGSMWGQIDGTAKITIAQQVVSSLLEEFPADQGLGLTVYGHRERGNCTDIETLVAPAPGTVGDIVTAVNGIKPLGKTPMTDAIIAAAEALRYTEDSATVILVSDGVETYNPDPCAAARLLEETGIDFTAHVIGFDVADDPEALAQMQCIAEETGGQFLTAATASELDLAMTAMMDPEPVIVTGIFEARIGDITGPLVTDPVIWDISNQNAQIVDDGAGNPLTIDLPEGIWQATAYRLVDEASAQAEITVAGSGDITVTVIFPDVTPDASITAPDSAPMGSVIQVGWTGPDSENDRIAIAEPDRNRPLAYTLISEGNPVDLQLPPAPGIYELRYETRGNDNKVLATKQIELTPVTATIDAPDTGLVGDTISVDWTGPDYPGDTIIMAQDGGSRFINPVATTEGSPLDLLLPAEPGTYTIRYQMGQKQTVLAEKTIEVSALDVTLEAPETAIAGDTIPVGWTGPDYEHDFIAVAVPGASGYVNYTYTDAGSPLDLQMPPEPGQYEIRYTLHQDRETIATRPITITAPEVSLGAADTATVSDTISVDWTGPNYAGDFISVSKPDDKGYENYTYTREGSPLSLEMPSEPGDYEIRYVLDQKRTIIASRPITVSAAQASVTASGTAVAGSQVSVTWVGPDYSGDYISVAKSGDRGYENYTYTNAGNPLDLEMPTEPGNYEIRYVLDQGATVIASAPITVSAVTASVTAPDTAIAGETLSLQWDGPGYQGDYISVGAKGADAYINYTYTNEGTPLQLLMPPTAGDYEIRYQLDQDGVIIFRAPITITPVKAQLVAPDMLSITQDLVVGWDGPDYQGDYVGIAAPGESGYLRYAYTGTGNPVTIPMPDAPGTYELRYFLSQDGTVVATRPIVITE